MLKRQLNWSWRVLLTGLTLIAGLTSSSALAHPAQNAGQYPGLNIAHNGQHGKSHVDKLPKWTGYLNDQGKLRNISNGAAFDLSSANNSIHLGNKLFGSQQSISINVGGNEKILTAGSAVTPAEYLAALQKIGFGSQALQLDGNGRAVGGSFTLNSISNAGKNIKVSELVVPSGVTGVGNFGLKMDFHLSGDLVNGGSLYVLSNKPGANLANLGAKDIVNAAGGLISSVVPVSISEQYGDTVSQLNLRLTADRDLANLGSITSSGNLDLNAGRSLYNGLPLGAPGPQPQITAANDVNISVQSGNVVNAALIKSDNGNINIGSSVLPQDLNVNNNSGTLQALSGSINFRQPGYSSVGNVNLIGGDLLSQEVNFYSGTGTVDAAVNDVTGIVNVDAGCAHIGASTPNLQFGELNVTGDPTYYNADGDITLSSTISTSGADLAILAKGNVTIGSGANISTANGLGGNAGNILIVAGANITAPSTGSGLPDGGSTTVTFANSANAGNGSTTGGKIDLSAMGSISADGITSGNAGNVTLIAYDGSGTGAGQINVSVPISAKGVGGSGTNGQVTMIAGETSATTTITTGSINIDGANSGGSITIAAATPEIDGGGSISVVNGTIQGGSGILFPGSLQPGALSIGAVTIDQADLAFQTTSSITVSSITGTIKNYVRTENTFSSGFSAISVTGSITFMTFGNLTIGNNPLSATTGLNLIAGGNIATNNAVITLSSGGGNFNVIAGAAFTQDTSSVTITGASTTGGNIDFNSSPCNLSSANGSGAGGDLTLIAFDGATNDGSIATAAGTNITTGGSSGNSNGDILVISNKAAAGSFSLGAAMNTTGGTSGTGNVEIYNTTPDTSPNVVISKATGAITGGDPRGGVLSNSSISIGGNITADGSTVTIQSGNDLTLSPTIVPQGGGSRPDLHTTAVGTTTTGTGAYTLDSWSMLSDSNIVLRSSPGTAPGGITWVAGGTVTGNNNGISINTNGSGDAGDMVIVAGAAFTAGTNDVTITGASSAGGTIDFNTSQVNLSTAASAGDGGNMTLVSFAGATNPGNILTTLGGSTTTGGSAGNSNGEFLAIAGRTSSGTALQLGLINTEGGTSGTGKVEIYNRTPSTIVIVNTNSAAITGDFRGGSLGGGAIATSDIVADGVSITIQSGGTLNIGNQVHSIGGTAPDLHTSSVGSTFTGPGTYTLNSWSSVSGDNIVLQNSASVPGGITLIAGSNIFGANSGINISTGSTTGDSGNFTMVAGAAFTEGTSSVTVTGASTQGGKIDLATSNVNIFSSSGGGGGDGGDITLIAFSGGTNDGSVKTGNSISTGATSGNTNGDFLVVAGATSGTAVTLQQPVSTTGGLTGTGNIEIYNSVPNTSTQLIISTSTGSFTQGDPRDGTVGGGSVSTSNLTVDGATIEVVAGTNVSLGNLTASTSSTTGNGGIIDITATGTQALNIGGGGANTIASVTINAGSTSGDGGTLSLTNNGNTGLTLSSIPVANPTDGDGRNISLDAGTGTLTVPNTITANAAGTDNNGGEISLAGGSLSFTGTLALTANGTGTGDGGAITVETRNASPTGDITVGSASGAITATTTGTAGSVEFIAGGTLTIANNLTTSGSISLGSDDVTINSGVTITSQDINITGQTVDGGSTTPMTLSNSGSIVSTTGGTIDVSSALGQDLHIAGDGSGVWQATDSNSINITATDNPTGVHPDLFFDANQQFIFTGSQTGTVNFTANGSQTAKVQVSNGVTLDFPTDNTTINVFTANFVLQGTGTLNLHNPPNTGTTLNLFTPAFPGTFANSTGPLDLGFLGGSTLLVHGGDLAFLSAGDIINTGGTINVDVSSSTGDAGRVSFIAGFSFTPGTGGVTVGPNAVDYALDATSSTSGSILLSNVNVDASSLGGNGGAVMLVANGSVAFGNITTTSLTGNGGSVNVIGQEVTLGNIDTTASTLSQSGAVSIQAASVQQGAINVHVIDGVVSGGPFTIQGVFGGLLVGSINAGTSTVDLVANTSIKSSGTITADTLTLTTVAFGAEIKGVTGDLLTNVSNLTAQTSNGFVFITDSAASVDLQGPNSGATFSLIMTNGSINIPSGGDMPTGVHVLVLEANGGTLSLPSNTVSVAAAIGGEGGYISLLGDSITWSGGGALAVDAQGTTAFGGDIFITTTGAQILSNVAGGYVLNARGTDGGLVNFVTDGALQVDMSGTTGIKVAPTALNGSGGHISLTGATVVNSAGGTLNLNVDGAGTGNGGTISVTLTNSPGTITIHAGDEFTLSAKGTNPGEIFFSTDGNLIVDPNAVDVSAVGLGGFSSGVLSLTAGTMSKFGGGTLLLDVSNNFNPGLNGGSIAVKLTNMASQTSIIGVGQDFQFNASGFNGGSVSFETNGDLQIDTVGVSVLPTNINGRGGTLLLTGETVTRFGGGTLILGASAQAAGAGSGGTVGINLTGTANAVIGTPGVGQYQLIANSGLLGGSGGTAIFTTNGNLTVNPTGISVNANVVGNGGSIFLEAGSGAGPGNLVVTGLLSALGKGGGLGGNISLVSNSNQAFIVGAAVIPPNGIFGTISTLSKPISGTISIENRGGGVSLLKVIANASSVSITALTTITTSVAVGGKATQSLSLEAGGDITGLSTKALLLGASSVTLDGANIGAFNIPLNFKSTSLTVNADNNVFLSSKGKLGLVVNSSTAGGAFSLTALGAVNNGILSGPAAITLPFGLTLSSKVGIGTLSPFLIDSGNLVLNGLGVDNITNVGAGSFTLGQPSAFAGTLTLNSGSDILVAGTFGTTAMKATINATGFASIIQNGGVLNGNTLTLTSLHGSVGDTGNGAVQVNAVFLSASAGTGVDILNNAAVMTLRNITANNGSILVNSGALTKSITIAGTGTIPASFIHATNGGITIQNNNLLGTVIVGPSARMITDGTGGPVFLTIGPAPSNPAVGIIPSLPGLTYNPPPGVGPYFIPNPITITTSLLTPINLTVIGAGKIVFNSQPLLPKGIQIKGGTVLLPTTITSDPPVSAASLAPVVSGLSSVGTAAAAASVQGAVLPQTSSIQNAIPQATGSVASVAIQPLHQERLYQPMFPATSAAGSAVTSVTASNAGLTPLQGRASYTSATMGGDRDDCLQYMGMETDADIIEATMLSEKDLGIPHNSGACHFNEATSGSRKTLHQHSGNMLLAPTRDITIETRFGSVKVAGGSVVLTMVTNSGLAIYNLDDSRRDAVVIDCEKEKVCLAPGKNALITAATQKSFEVLHPAQSFAYRNINSTMLACGLKLYTGEFSTHTALGSVKPLKQLFTSTRPEARRLADHLLKTTAILTQMNSGGMYQRMQKPSVAAWAR